MPTTATLKRPSPASIIEPAPPAATNGPTREDILFFAGQFKAAQEKVEEARTANKKIRQAAKLRGLEVLVLDRVMQIAEEGDDTELDRLRTFKTYAQAFDLPIGFQMDLFGSPTGNRQPESSVNEKAHRVGYERGVMGLNPDDQAYPPMTPEGQEHLRGWGDGQKVNADKFLKLNEEMAAAAAAKEARKQAKVDAAGGTTEH